MIKWRGGSEGGVKEDVKKEVKEDVKEEVAQVDEEKFTNGIVNYSY